jgi:hypothetical protein
MIKVIIIFDLQKIYQPILKRYIAQREKELIEEFKQIKQLSTKKFKKFQ